MHSTGKLPAKKPSLPPPPPPREKPAPPLLKQSSSLQDLEGEETGKPWSTWTRPPCAEPPQDNSFCLEDEALVAAVDAVMSGLTVSDPLLEDNPLLFVSAGFERMTGYHSDELMGENSNLLQRKKGEQESVDAMRSGVSARRPVTVQISNFKKDGKKFLNLVCMLPVLDGHNGLKLYLSVQCDIERKEDRAQFAAKWGEQVAHFLKAFALTDNSQEHAPFAVVNKGFTALTGYEQDELENCGVLSLGGPDSNKASLKKLLSSHWTDKPSGVRMLCYRKDGSPFWGYVWNCPLAERSNGKGQCKRHLILVFDVTIAKLKRMGKFMLGKVIGQGASGIVYKGLNTLTDEVVAVKSVDASRFRSISEIEQMQEEMNVSASLKHPNIVRLYEVNFNNNVFYLVMELSSGGSLMKYIHESGSDHGLDEADTHRLFVQMVSALDYCHRRRIIHRDLKPENILMDKDNNVKIADFGLAAISGFSSSLTLQCGTPEFSAPEISLGKEYEGTQIDIWSLGVILYEMLTGKLPFSGSTQALLFKSIQKGVYEPLRNSISEECRDLLAAMLTTEPVRRITMDDIVRHPWLRGVVVPKAVKAEASTQELSSPRPQAGGVGAAAERAVSSMGTNPEELLPESPSEEDLNSGANRASFFSANINMHDSVRIVLPWGAGGKDDPITAAMMRSQQGATTDDEEAQPSPTSTGRAARGGYAASTSASRAPAGAGTRPGPATTRTTAGGAAQDTTPSRLARVDLSEARSAKSGARSEAGTRPSARADSSAPKSSARSDVGVQPAAARNGGSSGAAARKAALPPLNTTSPPASESKRGTHEVAKDMMSRVARTGPNGVSVSLTSPTERSSPASSKGSPSERERRTASGGDSAFNAQPSSQPGTPPRSLPPLRRV